MKIDVGLCSITLRSLSPDQVIAVSERAGVAGIEWGADVHVPPGDLANASAVAGRCADAGIAVASYGSYLGVGVTTAGVPDDVGPVLDTAEALGAPVVRAWTAFGVTPASPAPDRQRVIETTAAAADAAAGRHLIVALEFHPGTLTETAASTTALLDALDRPNLRTHWQPDPTLSAAAQLDQLRAVCTRLAHLHVFQWGPTGIDDRRPLGDGAGLWPAALALAAEPGPAEPFDTRYALCEYVAGDDPEQLVADAAVLRRWIERLG